MKKISVFSVLLISCLVSHAQEKKAGPVIADYGKVWPIENQEYTIAEGTTFKVVFDIMNSPKDPAQLNKSIETAARFLNMHAQNGVPIEQMHVALVVHNKASKDICTNTSYNDRYGMDNPNTTMVQQLLEAGVDFIFCGQSSKSRNFPIEETLDGVQLSLSAMTALIQLQNDGYQLIKF